MYSRRLHAISSNRERLITVAAYCCSISIYLDLHIHRLPERSGFALMNIVEEAEFILGISIRADKAIVVRQHAFENRGFFIRHSLGYFVFQRDQ